MPKREGDPTKHRPILLLGAGRKPRELGACLAALDAVRAQGDGAVEPHRPLALADLEDLLTQRSPAGTLILDSERVPAEDIGFIRRFLERHLDWSLVLVGEDAKARRSRALLALPRSRWLVWPPDLDQLSALLGGSGALEGTERARPLDEVPRRRRRPAPIADEKPSGLDVGRLLEELLASVSLAGDGAPRYLYRCDETLVLQRDTRLLGDGLTAFLSLARRCAGEEGVVSAQADRAPGPGDPSDTVRIRIDFPPGPLREEEVAGLLDRPFAGAKELENEVAEARRAASDLREEGARVAVRSPQGERMRFELFVAASPLGEEKRAAAPRPAASGSGGKPEDPFA